MGPHCDALTLVGAQAVYLRVGEAEIPVAPTTTDADISFDPAVVKKEPALDALMKEAGFWRRKDIGGNPLVGIWEKRQGHVLVSVDLLIPAAVAPPGGRRAARIPGHGMGALLKVPGIEASLADAGALQVASLESDDFRSFEIRVAGQGALLVAKVHKILDREQQGNRLNDKDALDVFRLLRGTSTEEMAHRLSVAAEDARSRDATLYAVESVPSLFGNRDGEGVRMAVRATEGLLPEAEVVASLTALTDDLMSAVRLV
jgi:hypothetical protein